VGKFSTKCEAIVHGNRADGRECYKATLILVRSDQFVAWASDDMSVDTMEILQRIIGKDGAD
jgi:4-hydroxyisophthalate hydroxylase